MTKMRNIAAILGRTEAANIDNSPGVDLGDTVADSSMVTSILNTTSMNIYSTVDSLPVSPISAASLPAGTQAFVRATNRLYTVSGTPVSSGWYNVALVNATPALSLSSSGTIALTAGSPTTITMTATDSDNSNANLSLTLESGGDLFKFATVSQDSSVVTITPRTQDSASTLGSDGSATLTFKASDGINVASVQNTFTLSFEADWSANFAITKTIQAPTPTASNYYGSGVGVSEDGNDILVAEYSGDNASHNNIGAVYFLNTTDSWANYTSQKFSEHGTSYNNAADINFGKKALCISGDGNYAAVSASRHGTNLIGKVYIYKKTGSTWAEQTTIVGTAGSDYLGDGAMDMNYDGTVLAVGNTNENDVRLWTRSGTTWTARTNIAGSGNQLTGYGKSVRLSRDGNFLFVGFPQWTNVATSEPRKGRVYVYTRSGDNWAESAYFSPPYDSTNGTGDFGQNIAVNPDGTMIAVGCPGFTASGTRYNSSATEIGRVYIYTRPSTSSNTWSNVVNIDKLTTYKFGGDREHNMAMRFAGKFLFVGAGYLSYTTPGNYGVVHIFKDTSSGTDGTVWTEQQGGGIYGSESPLSISSNVYFGRHIGVSSNGAVLVVGEESNSTGQSNAGAIRIIAPAA